MNAASTEIERRMAEEAAVFVAGCNRSGTTALRHTLDQHPAFRVQREMCAGGGARVRSPETGVFADPERVFAIRDPRGRRLLRYLLGDEGAAEAKMVFIEPLILSEIPSRSSLSGRRLSGSTSWRPRYK